MTRRRGSAYGAGTAVVVAVLLGVAYLALRSSPAGEPAVRPERDDEVVALAADGWLWSYRPTSGRRLVRIDAPSDRPQAFGRYLAVSAGGELVVLSPRAGGAIAVVDVGRRRAIARGRLPRRLGGRAVVVGPRTGRLYVVARRIRPGRTRFGARRSDAVLLVRAPDARRAIARHLIRASSGHDWDVTAAAISPTEDLLAVSYHGDDTTGIDLVGTERSSARVRCPRAITADRACIPEVHGDVEFARGGLVAASGTEDLLEIGRGGAVARHDMRLVNSHVTALLLVPAGDAVYGLAQCGYVGGLSRVELRSGAVELPARPRESDVCGTGMALPGRDTLVVAGSRGPPTAGNDRLQWIGLATGRVETERTPGSPILALAPAP